jgi:hypothetical protein
VGEEILSGSWDQFGRAFDAGGAIQKNFIDDAFVKFFIGEMLTCFEGQSKRDIIIKIMFRRKL